MLFLTSFMDYLGKLDNIQTKKDFVDFLGALILDLKTNPDEWENPTLERYLDAAMAWTNSSDAVYRNAGEPIPQNVPWKVFASILAAAVIYE